MNALLVVMALQAAAVAEPLGYWTGAMGGDTPATLAGAQVIDDDALDTLIARETPVLIDVSPQEPRPPDVRIWLPTHRSIPGSVWVPGAGAGVLDAAREATLRRFAGDPRRPIVVFCHPRCWASWNAAKRLVTAGFTRVAWYPGGIEGWQRRHPTAVVTIAAGWTAPLRAGEEPVAQSAEKE